MPAFSRFNLPRYNDPEWDRCPVVVPVSSWCIPRLSDLRRVKDVQPVASHKRQYINNDWHPVHVLPGWYLWYKPVRGISTQGSLQATEVPVGFRGEGQERLGNKVSGFVKVGLHGERAEREPITGVWGRSPQRSPGAEPLVRVQGGFAPWSWKAFSFLTSPHKRQICLIFCIFQTHEILATAPYVDNKRSFAGKFTSTSEGDFNHPTLGHKTEFQWGDPAFQWPGRVPSSHPTNTTLRATS